MDYRSNKIEYHVNIGKKREQLVSSFISFFKTRTVNHDGLPVFNALSTREYNWNAGIGFLCSNRNLGYNTI